MYKKIAVIYTIKLAIRPMCVWESRNFSCVDGHSHYKFRLGTIVESKFVKFYNIFW